MYSCSTGRSTAWRSIFSQISILNQREVSLSLNNNPIIVCVIRKLYWTPDPLLDLPKVIHNTTFPRLATLHSWLRTFRAS